MTPQHCCDAHGPIARLYTRRSRAPSVGVKCMCTRCVKKVAVALKVRIPKIRKKSLIHENADANITCKFGDSDISRLGVANHQTHVYLITSIILRWIATTSPTVLLQLYISYVDQLLPRSERRRQLTEQYYFTCDCPVCTDDYQV